MKRIWTTFSISAGALLYAIAVYAGTSSATLTSFIQSGVLTNTSSPGVNIVEVYYTLGTPEDNIATWDSGTGGGTAEDFLDNPRWFQSVRWTGLNVAPGSTFNITGLDIDLIQTLSPLSVNEGILDTVGTSLRNGYIETRFSDGSVACAPLVEQAWSATQNLTLLEANVGSTCSLSVAPPPPPPSPLAPATPVPTLSEWAMIILSMSLGIIAIFGLRRRLF